MIPSLLARQIKNSMESPMDRFLNDFINYLFSEKKMAQNSLQAYKRDVLEFSAMIR